MNRMLFSLLYLMFLFFNSTIAYGGDFDKFSKCDAIPVFMNKDGSLLFFAVSNSEKNIHLKVENLVNGSIIEHLDYMTSISHTNDNNVFLGVSDQGLVKFNYSDGKKITVVPFSIFQFNANEDFTFSINSDDVLQIPIDTFKSKIPFSFGATGWRTLLLADTQNHEIVSLNTAGKSYSSWLRGSDGAIIAEHHKGTETDKRENYNEMLFFNKSDSTRKVLGMAYPNDANLIGMNDDEVFLLSNLITDTFSVTSYDIRSGAQRVLYTFDDADINPRDVTMSPSRQKVLSVGVEGGTKGFKSDNDNVKMFSSEMSSFYGSEIIEAKITLISELADRIVARLTQKSGLVEYILWSAETHGIKTVSSCHPFPSVNLRNVTIEARDGVKLRNMIVTPKTPGPWPFVVYVHGGPEDNSTGVPNEIQFMLAYHGIASISVNYRGSSGRGIKFKELGFLQYDSGMANDVEDSISWLVSNNLSRDIGVLGISFGGVLSYNLLKNHPKYIKSMVLLSSVFDIRSLISIHSNGNVQPDNSIKYFGYLGDYSQNTRIKMASPLTGPSVSYPSTLIIHGEDDEKIPVEQAKEFLRRYSNNNSKFSYVQIAGMRHESKPNTPQRQEIISAIVDFYKRELSLSEK